MSDDKHEERGKTPRRISKIVHHRCCVCGGRKKEEDIYVNNHQSGKKACTECCEKQAKQGSYWGTRGGETVRIYKVEKSGKDKN